MAFADLVAQPRTDWLALGNGRFRDKLKRFHSTTGQLVQKNYTNFDRRTQPSNSDPGLRTSTH